MKYIRWTVILVITLTTGSCTNKHQKAVTIGFAGDTMLGRLVNGTITKKGYTHPWGNLLPLLEQTDFNIINLENTFTTSIQKLPKVFNFKADPANVESLKQAHINVVNLANNHILDFGNEGLFNTIQALDTTGIKHVGAGKNQKKAKQGVIITKNNIKIGIIGYTDNEPDWKAQTNKPGINYVKVGDIATIQQDIKIIRPQVDILIITIHWGPNMRQHPNQEFTNFAHAIIDSGVDIIHGHSAHIFQGVEIYQDKLIMYDTGDFVDDYAINSLLRNDQSLFFIVTVTKTGINKVQLVPLLISNLQVNYTEGTTKKEILDRVKTLSAVFGTKIQNDTILIQ